MLINIDFRWLKQGIKNRNSVLNRVRVWGAAPHLPIQGYIEYPPGFYGVSYSCKNKYISFHSVEYK